MERPTISMILATNLKAAIERLGISPAEVARRASVGESYVYDIYYGRSVGPRIDRLERIAVRGLGITLASLLSPPIEDGLRQEIVDAAGTLPVADQRRLLDIARALRGAERRSDDGKPARE